MQINNINSTQTNFKSKFVPNKYLESAFENAYNGNNRTFVKSIKAILNDGKQDSIELVKGANSNLHLLVNGKIKEESIIFSYYGNPSIDVIEKYAKQINNLDIYNGAYKNLSNKEKKLVQEDVNLIKSLTENFEDSTNFIDNSLNRIQKMKQKIDKNTKQEIVTLKEIIFNKK